MSWIVKCTCINIECYCPYSHVDLIVCSACKHNQYDKEEVEKYATEIEEFKFEFKAADPKEISW